MPGGFFFSAGQINTITLIAIGLTRHQSPGRIHMFRAWLNRPVINRLRIIMTAQAQHAADLRALKEQNDKASAEQAAALQKVQDALDAAGGTTAEVDVAMEELRASIQRDDDLNPDAPVDPQA